MKKYLESYAFLFTIAGLIISLDQWTKCLVRSSLGFQETWSPWEWLAPYARIVHWRNTGAVFGIFQNFNLLKEVGQTKKPVLLKRGLSSTIKEMLMSAEYILSAGNFNVMLCERGIRTFEDFTRNTLDISAVPAIKQLSHLPVIVDPSHASGRWGLVGPLAKAAVAAGADGLIIEVHSRPEEAYSDGAQSLLPSNFAPLVVELKAVAEAVGRTI